LTPVRYQEKKNKKDRQRKRHVQKKHTFTAEHAQTLKQQFDDGKTLILAACQIVWITVKCTIITSIILVNWNWKLVSTKI